MGFLLYATKIFKTFHNIHFAIFIVKEVNVKRKRLSPVHSFYGLYYIFIADSNARCFYSVVYKFFLGVRDHLDDF